MKGLEKEGPGQIPDTKSGCATMLIKKEKWRNYQIKYSRPRSHSQVSQIYILII